jgi:hypothetical protein
MTSIEKLETNPFPPGIMLDTDPRYDFVRETVSEMYHTAQQRALDKSIPSEFVNDSIAQLRRVPGITLLEMRDFRSDFDFRVHAEESRSPTRSAAFVRASSSDGHWNGHAFRPVPGLSPSSVEHRRGFGDGT